MEFVNEEMKLYNINKHDHSLQCKYSKISNFSPELYNVPNWLVNNKLKKKHEIQWKLTVLIKDILTSVHMMTLVITEYIL